MPLVIFNWYQNEISSFTNINANPLEQTLTLPDNARNVQWTLRAVNALYGNNNDNFFNEIEVDFPELMTSENVLYASKTIGNVETPPDTLRFYTKKSQLSQAGETLAPDFYRTQSTFNVVSEYPDWSFGRVNLEKSELTCRIRPRLLSLTEPSDVDMDSISIILSYEE